MTRSTLFALALALAACYAHDANAAVSIPELRAEIASNSVDRSVRCRYYTAWYRDLCTEAEREAILERNVAAHRKWIEIAGKDDTARIRAELGRVLAIGGRWDEAEKELSAAIAGNISGLNLAAARWALAECLWRRGATDGAKKIVAEIAAMDFDDPIPFVWRKAKFMHRAWTDPDGDIDAFKLPHSVDGKPFPTPRDAKYGEKKVGLGKVEVSLKEEVRRKKEEVLNDPIVRLLKRKLTRFGSKFEKGGTKINIEISPDAPVDKPQGYSLEVKRKKKEGRSGYGVVSIKARDRLGATYGVVSLLQCVERRDGKDEGRPRVRECAIRDWPLCLKRGVGAYWDGDHLEYSLFAKMRFVSMRLGGREYWDILFSPMERERCRLTVSRYQDFGLYCNWSERWLVVDPMLPLSSPRVRAMHLDWMRYAASIGANICFVMDDDRFPLPPADVEAAGTAANLDAKYLTGLYREVKSEYPRFWIVFCPPFYWGPDGAVNYPEPRVAYLKSIAENLDSEIAVTWTGPRVKTCSITPKKFKWFADLVGRRPIPMTGTPMTAP